MGRNDRTSLLLKLGQVERAATESLSSLDAALASLRAVQTAIQDGDNTPSKALPACDVPQSDHRREHRSGRAARLDTDTELRVFVLARIDRLTYDQIADDIAKHFPKNRRVGRSAIHHWWNKPEVRKRYAG